MDLVVAVTSGNRWCNRRVGFISNRRLKQAKRLQPPHALEAVERKSSLWSRAKESGTVHTEEALLERLGEDVRRVLLGLDVDRLDDLALDELADEEVATLDVLGLGDHHGVVRQVDRR